MLALALSTTLLGAPLAPIVYTACLTDNRAEADMAARQVASVGEALWCVSLVKDCAKADLLIFKDQGSHVTFVIDGSCKK